jgi:hypothetical protein
MTKAEILNQAKQNFGLVPDWLSGMPDAILEQYWATLNWIMSDTKMTARDKVLCRVRCCECSAL